MLLALVPGAEVRGLSVVFPQNHLGDQNASALYGGTGVNVAGVGNWSLRASGTQTFQSYSDAKGNITFTLQDGSVSYWDTGSSQVVTSAPTSDTPTVFTDYLPADQSNYSTNFQVCVWAHNPGAGIGSGTNWDTDGSVTW